MNHTHFIFLDDGTIGNYDVGDYRTRLVKTIAHGRLKQALSGMNYFIYSSRFHFIEFQSQL